jgi:excisionase family DNA binding protein
MAPSAKRYVARPPLCAPTHSQPDSSPQAHSRRPALGSIEQLLEEAVYRAVHRLLAPYLSRLAEPEPLVYTVSQAAAVLQVSPDTVTRLVRRGVLERVPHVDGKQLIPRASIDRLVAGTDGTVPDAQAPTEVNPPPVRELRRTSDP